MQLLNCIKARRRQVRSLYEIPKSPIAHGDVLCDHANRIPISSTAHNFDLPPVLFIVVTRARRDLGPASTVGFCTVFGFFIY
jgi:hypothetical protein